MNKKIEATLYELLEYITKTLKYYSKKDYEYHKVCLSLTRHTARELIPLVEKELSPLLEGEEE